MFKVPVDAEHPTLDDTFEVSFLRWFTSKGAERKEWIRRRNVALLARRDAKLKVIADKHAEDKARYDALVAKLEAERAAGGSEKYKAAKARLAARFARRRRRAW